VPGSIPPAAFVISLDFELMWGVRDALTPAQYGRNILGVREAIPAMLALFKKYKVHATWAAVGLLLFDNKRDLLGAAPCVRPTYARPKLSPYHDLESIGDSEQTDPYHYGLSLARRIIDCDGMELASHTFSHYYCLEDGQTKDQFRADLEASVAATQRLGLRPSSLVFPRNQYNADYLSICAQLGFTAFRGNESPWYYQKNQGELESMFKRSIRLIDSFANLSGHNGFVPMAEHSVCNVPSSRFLRPSSTYSNIIESLRLARIEQAMTAASAEGKSFHLWWHPHNFGINLTQNLSGLEQILRHHLVLRDRYGVQSMTMAEVAATVRPRVQ
jgi:peptidoglycan/xylan/chitin deacetylase (PgdA/CDA1 family)